jgi:phosphoglycerate dehydrogenase-like enzyme
MASLLYHVKQFRRLEAEQRDHSWQRYCAESLFGKTLAVLGPGRIGREVARLASAFGMTVWALARDENPARASELGVARVFPRSELHTMLAAADAVVLATPATPETEGMIGQAEFAALKPGAAFINIARGTIVDEPALIDALRSGQVGFAALDVTAIEPLPPDSPLWDMPNVLISPHSASTVAGENALITDRFITNMTLFLQGNIDRMAPVLDKARMY